VDRQVFIEEFIEKMSLLRQSFIPLSGKFFENKTLEGEFNLTRSQFAIMMIVYRQPKISLQDIADKLSLSASAVSQLVDSLQENKMLERATDEGDRRKISLNLSVLGMEKMAKARMIWVETLKNLFSGLDDKDLANLKLILEKIIQHLQENA
jgi:DNA-binding MarR family transcriptional regulator